MKQIMLKCTSSKNYYTTYIMLLTGIVIVLKMFTDYNIKLYFNLLNTMYKCMYITYLYF